MPCVKWTTEPIKRGLNNNNIKVALKPHQTIDSLFQFFPKPKDPVPKDQVRGIFYSIPCKDCGKLYIGDTKRKFSTRLREHKKAIEKRTSWEICTRRTLFTIWSGSSTSWWNRRLLEPWEINTCKSPLNHFIIFLLPLKNIFMTLMKVDVNIRNFGILRFFNSL